MRYWRGHGVHSPFVYNMVRKVFMARTVVGADTSIADMLVKAKATSKHTAVQIQNLCDYCGYSSAKIFESNEEINCDLIIFDKATGEQTITEGLKKLNPIEHKAAIILAPHSSKARHKICSTIIEQHSGISIDKFSMLILLFDDTYQKQHYKI